MPTPRRRYLQLIRRKCFVSYHAADLAAVNDFIERFGQGNFIKRGVTLPDEVINSTDTAYVLRRIRQLYLQDTTVTIVLIGSCTWSRRFVDWELQASLRRPADALPNGVLAIRLAPSGNPTLPERFRLNLESGYARHYVYPDSTLTLREWIEDAYRARTERANLIDNPRARRMRNSPCGAARIV